jgi:arabinofuranan 3-O-arabinosyltransferase
MIDWLVDKDFANYWIAARLVLGGQVLDLFADHATYFRHLTTAFGPDYQWRNWSYPPHYLLAIWPLGLFGYVPALIGFLAVTLAAYGLALRAFLGRLPIRVAAALILGPAVYDNIQHAQNGFLTAALMLGALALRLRRPVLAGVLFGCLTVKPQLGVLIPLLLLVERQWLVIGSAALTTVALVALSAALFGWEAWLGYLTETLPYQSQVMTSLEGVFPGMMPTVFGALRVLQVDPDTALAVHGVVAALAVVAAGWVLWRCQDAGLRAAVTLMATLVVVPYWLTYDYTIAAAALLLVHQSITGSDPASVLRRRLLVVAAVTPLAAIPLWMAGAPLTPLLVLLGFGLVLKSASDAKV